MNLMELKKSLSEDKVQNLYVFYGIEYAVLEVYITKIKNKFNGAYRSYESVEDLMKQLTSNSFFCGVENSLFIVREDKDFLSNDTMWDSLIQKLTAKNCTLILKYTTLDKRGKFYKAYEDYVTEFTRMSAQVVISHIIKTLNIDKADADTLATLCMDDYGRILLEMDKVINFAQYYDIPNSAAIKELFKQDAFYKEVDGEIYDLVNAFMSRDVKVVKKRLDEFNRRGDSPLAFLTILHNTVKATLQVKCIGKTDRMAEVTGLAPYQIKNTYNHIKNFTEKELITIIRYCKYCDNCIKNGCIDADMIVEYMIVNCL